MGSEEAVPTLMSVCVTAWNTASLPLELQAASGFLSTSGGKHVPRRVVFSELGFQRPSRLKQFSATQKWSSHRSPFLGLVWVSRTVVSHGESVVFTSLKMAVFLCGWPWAECLPCLCSTRTCIFYCLITTFLFTSAVSELHLCLSVSFLRLQFVSSISL